MSSLLTQEENDATKQCSLLFSVLLFFNRFKSGPPNFVHRKRRAGNIRRVKHDLQMENKLDWVIKISLLSTQILASKIKTLPIH